MAKLLALGAVGLGLVGCLYSPRVWAETAPVTEPSVTTTFKADAPTPNAAKGDDLVILKDGTRYRGTILEAVANDHILIQIAADTLREAPMSEVVYAGSVQEAPATGPIKGAMPPAMEPVKGTPTAESRAPQLGEVVVHFQTRTPELIVWMEEVESPTAVGMVRFCEAPCSRPVMKGQYRVFYSVGDSKPRAVSSTLNLTRETWLEGNLESERNTRVFGFVVLGIGGTVGSILLSSAAAMSTVKPDTASNHALAGAAFIAGGLMLGLPLGLTRDTAVVVEVSGPEFVAHATSGGQRRFSGLSLRGSF